MNKGRWWLALGFLGFGFAAVGNWTSAQWIAITLFLYSIPLAIQFSPNRVLRVYGIWFGAFLVIQTIITPLVIDRNFITLPPDLDQRIEIRGNAMPGLSGMQTITTDRNGFRVTRSIDYTAKPKGTLRIFAVGGSTTEQILLDDRRTWTHQLQEQLIASGRFTDVEVINTGVSGTRARQHLATLGAILKWEPDLVVLMMGINDWNQAIWEEFGGPERENAGVPQNMIQFSETLLGKTAFAVKELFAEPPSEEVRLEFGEYYSQQNDSLKRTDVREYRPDEVSASYRRMVEHIAKTCKGAGIRCMFVSQPNAYSESASEEIKRHFWMTPPNTRYTLDLSSLAYVASLYNQYLMTFAAQQGLLRCDLAAMVEPTTDVFYDECHFNVSGASRVAAHMAACVLDELGPE